MASALYLGTRKGLFVAERDASGWSVTRVALLGQTVTMLLPQRDGALLVAVEHGHYGAKLQRSMDQGLTWEERPVPKYPPQPENEPDLDPIQHTPVPWDLKRIWAFEQGPLDRPGELWSGTIPGGLFRSADNGESWDCYGEGMRAAYMPPEKAFDPQIQDPHCVVHCPASPDHLWVQHHNGIFRSTDGGLHWAELEPEDQSSFGFGVVVHPEDPDRAWFVPGVRDDERYPRDGAVSVTRTRDGGKSFENMRSGLPQSHAYDLTYRHGLAISGSGEELAFGTTTGNCWLSEDQGDSWSQITGTLPPIYCVRFL
jgi:hypothetical protein